VKSFSGTVTRYEPPRFFSHTWDFGGDATEVCYELEPQDDNVLLVLTHKRLASSDVVLSVSGGWHTHLDTLADVLEGRDPRPFWKSHTENSTEYEKRQQS
jgi:uncharacterized protein YndB with AHSA1/START domain